MWLSTAALALFAIQFLKGTGNSNALTDAFKKNTPSLRVCPLKLKIQLFLRCVELSTRNN